MNETAASVSAIIAEDEAPQRHELKGMLSALWPGLNVVAECEDGLAALEALTAHRPRIAFLDIRMPGVSGLEVARAANGISHVVFTTAYDEYALQAFDSGAVDYLLKPIKRDRLVTTIERLKERLNHGSTQDIRKVIEALEGRMADRDRRGAIKWITANIGATTKMFPIEDVLFFQAQDKYTRVATASDEAIIRTPLKELLEGLDAEEFWQIHRSVIVRVSAIRAAQRHDDGRFDVRLRGREDLLPVSGAFQYRFKGM